MFPSICRVCLTGHVKMFDIETIGLREIYEAFTNNKLITEDGKPMTICYLCRSQLLKSYRFYEMSQRAEKLLFDLANSWQDKNQKALIINQGMLHNLSCFTINTISLGDANYCNEVSPSLKQEIEKDEDIESVRDYEEFNSGNIDMNSERDLSNFDVENANAMNCFQANSVYQSEVLDSFKEQKYICDTCNQAFLKKSAILNHLRIHQNDSIASKLPKVDLIIKQNGGSNDVCESKKSCNKCDRIFTSESQISFEVWCPATKANNRIAMGDVDDKVSENVATTATKPIQQASGKSKGKKNQNRKKSQGSNNTVSAPIPKEARASAPAPKNLSTMFTKPNNEPMFEDLDIQGFGMTAYVGRNRMAITTEGFIPLLEKEYVIIATFDPNFQKTVSRSMFVYYAVQHLYARLVYLKADEAELDFEEERYLEYVGSGHHSLPDPIGSYINAIGVVSDATGVKYRLEFPAWPNKHGHFGKVDEHSHYKYASLPAPAVLSERIKKDLEYSIQQKQANWDIPIDIQPTTTAANVPGLPTKNLLGWAPSVSLTNDQKSVIEGFDVTAEEFPTNNKQFQLHVDLFRHVSIALEETKNIKVSKAQNTTSVGNQALIGFTERESVTVNFVRNEQYLESANVRQVGAQQLDAHASLSGLLFSFRVRKQAMKNGNNVEVHPWSIYDYGEYANVPASWVATANRIFEYGRAARLNLQEFTTTYTSKDVYRGAWLSRHRR